MKINALKAFIALITTLLFFVLVPRALALQVSDKSYACDYEMQVKINENDTVDFVQQINLANLQKKNLLTAMSVSIPFKIQDIKLRNGLLSSPQFVDSVYENGIIEVNFGKFFVEGQHAATFTLTYSSSELIQEDANGWRSFYLPKFDYCDSPFNTISITYPEGWGKPKYSTNFDSSSQIAMYWGEYNNFGLDMSWNQSYGSAIAIPSSTFNELIIEQASKDVEVFKDDWNNEYLTALELEQERGSLQAILRKKEIPQKLPVLPSQYYTNLVGINEGYQLSESSREGRYYELIDKLVPNYATNSQAKFEYSQDALGYAVTWATALETEGLNPYIVFGPVLVPKTNHVFWNYWVVISIDGKLVQYDPYFDDAYGFDSYEQVTPLRQIWGMLSGSNTYLVEGLNNIGNIQELLGNRIDSDLVLGDKFDVHALIETDKELANRVNLLINNQTNHIIYLDEILLDNKLLSKELYNTQGVLPAQTKTIDLSSVINIPELIAKGDAQKAEVLGLINGQNVVIPVKIQINHNSLIFLVFFIILLAFYYSLINLILRARQGILLKWQTVRAKPMKAKQEIPVDTNPEDIFELPHKRPDGYRRRIRL